MAVELPTVLLMGPFSALCLWATVTRSPWKHVLIILTSWCEIIGGWYTCMYLLLLNKKTRPPPLTHPPTHPSS